MTELLTPIHLSARQRLDAIVRNHRAWFHYQIRLLHDRFPDLLGTDVTESTNRADGPGREEGC